MTLRDLCEPLFQELCRLNRLTRKGGGSSAQLDHDIARIRSIFERMKAAASADVSLVNQYHLIKPALVYFVDFMMSESKLAYAGEWRSMEEEEYGTLVG